MTYANLAAGVSDLRAPWVRVRLASTNTRISSSHANRLPRFRWSNRDDPSDQNPCLCCYAVRDIGVLFVSPQPRCGTCSAHDGWFESLALLGSFCTRVALVDAGPVSDAQTIGAQIQESPGIRFLLRKFLLTPAMVLN